MSEFYKWKPRSGCYFCFYQSKMTWVGLWENYEYYKKAMSYEYKNHPKIKRKDFGWCLQMPLSEIIKPKILKKSKKSTPKNRKKNEIK